MSFSVRADIIPLIKGITNSLLSYAQAQDIRLDFKANVDMLKINYHPELYIKELATLISRVISFTPQGHSVQVRVLSYQKNDGFLRIKVSNTGSCLKRLGDIVKGISIQVKVASPSTTSTTFVLLFPLLEFSTTSSSVMTNSDVVIIPQWYSEIQKSLTNYFQSPSALEKAAYHKGEKEGIFLSKVNAIIRNQLVNESFNAGMLADAMALSTSQLFRKVKQLTFTAPAKYILLARLKHAKHLLETKELTVSEVGYQCGFASISHFSRTFHKEFGFSPSILKRGDGEQVK
jgi:AraC-like DNA-binding protein